MADLFCGCHKQHDYGEVMLPFTVLRRLDCVFSGHEESRAGAAPWIRSLSVWSVMPGVMLGRQSCSVRSRCSDHGEPARDSSPSRAWPSLKEAERRCGEIPASLQANTEDFVGTQRPRLVP